MRVTLLYCRFVPIQHRPGVRAVVAEKFVEIFTWYESDIDEVHKMYESNKVRMATCHPNHPNFIRLACDTGSSW